MNPSRQELCVRALLAGAATAIVALGSASVATAGTVTFGSPLNVPATMSTNELDYTSHTHDGADTALWNVAVPGEPPTAPVAGEVKSIKLEGCAEEVNGVKPLAYVHFQDLHPVSGGGVEVVATATSNEGGVPFEVPICSRTVTDRTITPYAPVALCVLTGDYVGFNDEGGFEEPNYPAGTPFKVIGEVSGATMYSFIGDNETNNGATLTYSKTNGARSGFATNSGQELMMQVTELEGNTYYCHGAPEAPAEKPSGGGGSGGGKTESPGSGGGSTKKTTPKPARSVLKLTKKSEKVKKGVVDVPVSCDGKAACTGTVVLKAKSAKGGTEEIGHATLTLAGGKKKTVLVKLDTLGRKRVRAAAGKRFDVAVTLRAASGEPANVGTLLVK
jgi:hypothetical protein